MVVQLDTLNVPRGSSVHEGVPSALLMRTPSGTLFATAEHPWHTVSNRETLCQNHKHTRRRRDGIRCALYFDGLRASHRACRG